MRGILVAGVLLGGCRGILGLEPPARIEDAAVLPADAPIDAKGFFANCMDVLTADPSAADGSYLIDPDGPTGTITAFHVWCSGLAKGTPVEYLDLAGKPNTTTYAGGGYCACPTYTRSFTRARIDVVKMELVIGDYTFSSLTNASCSSSNCFPSSTALGHPGSCVGTSDSSGSATVDLSGTELHLLQTVYSGEGFIPAGNATYGSNGKTLIAHGGGACGWWNPTGGSLHVVRDGD
jgi:hypothetical protein